MNNIDEAVRYLKQAYDFIHSLDGYMIKLDTAIGLVTEEDESLVEEFFYRLKEEGLLDRVSCHKDDLDTVVTKSRFPHVYRHMDILKKVLDETPCIEPFRVKVPQPSKQANQLAWGREYRDIKIKKRARFVRISGIHLSPTMLLALSMISSIAFFYGMYYLLKMIF